MFRRSAWCFCVRKEKTKAEPMNKILKLFFVLPLMAFGADELDLTPQNQLMMKQLKQKNSEYRFLCYSKFKTAELKIGQSLGLTQEIKVQQKLHTLEVSLLNEEEIKVSMGEKSYIQARENLGFHKDMIDTKKASEVFEMPALSLLNCFYGPSSYFSTLNPDATILMHYSKVFFGRSDQGILNYDNYLYEESGRSGDKLISMHVQTYRTGEELENFFLFTNTLTAFEDQEDITYVGRDTPETQFVIAPLGHLHYELKADDVMIMGGFTNMCITNSIFSLARALISTDKMELKIILPIYMTYSQGPGMVDELDISRWSGNRGWLKNLVIPDEKGWLSSLTSSDDEKEIPVNEDLIEFQAEWKKYLEGMLNQQVEVVFEDEKAKTQKQVLRITYLK